MAVNTPRAIEHRERREWYKAHGICEACGQNWAEPGYVRCKECKKKADARLKRFDPDGQKHKAYVKALRDERREKGLCIDCGSPNDGIHTRCARCAERRKDSVRIYKFRQRNERALKEGRT